MPPFTQAYRPLAITTPLGADALLLSAMQGYEVMSGLFNFKLDLLAELGTEIRFDRILGQEATVELQLLNGEKRYFNGIINAFTEGAREDTFATFSAQLVPKVWLLTKQVRSRIFQYLTVPEILAQVLAGFDVSYELLGTYSPRPFCVQYSESDFDFLSRLMEEEGIFYFFKHTDSGHRLTISDTPKQHPTVSGQSSIVYGGVSSGVREDMRIITWQKTQYLRHSEYTLWDHSFQLPGNPLEGKESMLDTVPVGKASHKLKPLANTLENYTYPGGYARRFDGISRTGAPQPQDLQGVFEDRQRTVRVRIQQEESTTLEITGTSDCGNLTAGCAFTLLRHFNADDKYLLTRVEHTVKLGGYEANDDSQFDYQNRFTCIPAALPYRPACTTAKPRIFGIQTATVVGPPGEQIYCDKYGRVKVQFHWDREGKKDASSSCWLRVAQIWAGDRWGAFFWPRVGNEVVVAFEDGDPDRPLIVGSVYNADNLPPFELPLKNNLDGIKSVSERGRANQNFNGLIFNDENGHEHLSFHSEHNMSFNSEFDKMFHAGRHKGERVSAANMLTVGNLPGGAGSGGGFDAGNPMPQPKPQAVLGLNSQWTFGENLQVAFGLNHQLAFGNNVQLCINPLSASAGDPTVFGAPILTSLFGSGAGGNMQFTLGTSASFVMGQAFDINLGPHKIEVSAGSMDHPGSRVLADMLILIVVIWGGLYAVLTDDVSRAWLTVVFQALIDATLAGLMLIEMSYKKGDSAIDDALRPLFRIDSAGLDVERQYISTDISAFIGSTVLMAGLIAEPIIATMSETYS